MRRGRRAEDIAVSVLKDMGFEIIERNKRLEINGETVAEIDIIAEKDGETYAVEVKAGTVGVDAIRQVKMISDITGYKPMVMGRRIHPSAEVLAKRFDVEVLEFPEYVEVEPADELASYMGDELSSRILALLAAASDANWRDLAAALKGDLKKVTRAFGVRDGEDARNLAKALSFLKLMACETLGVVKGVEGDEAVIEMDPRVPFPDSTTLLVANRHGTPIIALVEPESFGKHRIRVTVWEGDLKPGDRVVAVLPF